MFLNNVAGTRFRSTNPLIEKNNALCKNLYTLLKIKGSKVDETMTPAVINARVLLNAKALHRCLRVDLMMSVGLIIVNIGLYRFFNTKYLNASANLFCAIYPLMVYAFFLRSLRTSVSDSAGQSLKAEDSIGFDIDIDMIKDALINTIALAISAPPGVRHLIGKMIGTIMANESDVECFAAEVIEIVERDKPILHKLRDTNIKSTDEIGWIPLLTKYMSIIGQVETKDSLQISPEPKPQENKPARVTEMPF